MQVLHRQRNFPREPPSWEIRTLAWMVGDGEQISARLRPVGTPLARAKLKAVTPKMKGAKVLASPWHFSLATSGMCLPHISVLRCPTSPSRCIPPRLGSATALGCAHAKVLSPFGWEKNQVNHRTRRCQDQPSQHSRPTAPQPAATTRQWELPTFHSQLTVPCCTRTSHQDLQP